MSKDPAFLFYASDFLTGVSDLSMDERGVYITLLCLQHQKGRLTKKVISLCGGNATADVLAKFRQDENGLFYNERLEVEIDKRKQHAEKQRQRAVDGWKKRKEDVSHGNATAMPLEDINRNVNEIELIRCIEISLKDERWIRLNKTNVTELQIFKTKLETEGINYKTTIDFKTHFARWKKKQPDDLKAVQTTRISI
jgi:uncharacterized protein YdaU (DUF1376 family)